MHYGIQVLFRVLVALGKHPKPLGNIYVMHHTRQCGHGIALFSKELFAECFSSGTRQAGHSAKKKGDIMMG